MPHSMLTAWLGAFCTHVVIIIYQSVKALGSHVRVSTNKIGKSETFFLFGWFLLEWVDLNVELTTQIDYTRKTINKMHLNFTCSLCLYTFCLICLVEQWSESWYIASLIGFDLIWKILNHPTVAALGWKTCTCGTVDQLSSNLTERYDFQMFLTQ